MRTNTSPSLPSWPSSVSSLLVVLSTISSDEEPAKVGWTHGKYGRRTVDEESGCAYSGG